MGGLDGNMTVVGNMTGTQIDIDGNIEQDGAKVGTFSRMMDLQKKEAKSAYFSLDRSVRKQDIGKNLMAGNVETYKDLGIEKVKVFANIDVGGYAWAKYGYVPEATAWASLSSRIESKLSGGSSSGGRTSSGNEADDWDQLSSDTQDDVRDRWMRDSYDEFLSSEVQNWRDSGQAKADAKYELANMFAQYDSIPEWANDAFNAVREQRAEAGQSDIPFNNEQLFNAIDLKYESYHGDGTDDPKIEFDDDKLKEPIGFDPAQGTLPGIEPEDPAARLTDEMRERIEKEMVDAFDTKAENDADDQEPPSYLAESVGEYQEQYWDQKEDREKLQHAVDYGMADIPVEDDEEEQPQLELPKSEEDALLAAARSNDPKSIWKIADSPRGKELLLGTSWDGVLNLNDKASMDRFNAYVGRREQHA
jgi:hypothetical protein